jgi:hypothetical protein
MVKITLILAIIFCFTACEAPEKVDIRLNLEEGAVYKMQMDTEQDIEQNVMGQQHQLTNTVSALIVYTVNEVTEDAYHVTVSYDDYYFEIASPSISIVVEKGVEYQKGDNEIAFFQKILSRLFEHSFELKINKEGQVLESKGLDFALGQIFSEMDIEMDEEQDLVAQFEDMFGKEGVMGSFEVITTAFPERAVAKGEKWTTSLDAVGTAYPMHMETVWVLEDFDENTITLMGEATMTTTDDELLSPELPDNVHTDIKIDGTQSTQLKVNRHNGWIIEGESYSEADGKIRISERRDMSEAMEMPMKIKTKVTYKLVE